MEIKENRICFKNENFKIAIEHNLQWTSNSDSILHNDNDDNNNNVIWKIYFLDGRHM